MVFRDFVVPRVMTVYRENIREKGGAAGIVLMLEEDRGFGDDLEALEGKTCYVREEKSRRGCVRHYGLSRFSTGTPWIASRPWWRSLP